MRSTSLWLGAIVFTASVTVALNAQTQSSSSGPKPKKKPPAQTAVQKDVQALRDLVGAQQQQLEAQKQQLDQVRGQLQQLLDTSQQTTAQAQKLQSSAEQAQSAATQAQQSAAAAQQVATQASSSAVEAKTGLALVTNKEQDQEKQVSALKSVLGRFRLSGDVRIRGESYEQPCSGCQDRDRARIRARFGVDGQLGEDFSAGIAVATGSLADPSSTNETLTNAFDRKTIALDRAWITYNPAIAPWFSATGGKFAYTWQRTSITFDPDLNPEGFNEKASFNLDGSVLKNFTVQGIELLYNENSTAQDSYTLGGQASAKLQLGAWSATPSFLSLKWNRPDAILQESAFAVGATTTGSTAAGSFPVPGEGQGCAKGLNFSGFAPCVFAPNGMTNATFTDSSGKTHFYSGFNYADFILNNQIKTSETFPLNLLVEFEDNLDAEPHPLDSKGNVLTNLGSQNKEYGADFSVGQTRNKNDLQFGYSWYREEQDAVIASFVESDQRAPTNIVQNRIYALWKLRANTLASFTWWRGRVLNTDLENNAALYNTWGPAKTITTPGQQEPYLNRLQFDLIYTF